MITYIGVLLMLSLTHRANLYTANYMSPKDPKDDLFTSQSD